MADRDPSAGDRSDPSGEFEEFAISPSSGPILDPPLAPGTMVGEFRVEHLLGEGAMAEVYAATHPLIQKKAAIKVMRRYHSASLDSTERYLLEATAVDRFLQEARAVNQIGHPNIVDVFAFGKLPDGRNYFVMEWLQGETLAARLLKCILPVDETVEILDQIGDALGAAHDKGIVHRDLKPDNLFLIPMRGKRLIVKLLDFGVAKLVGAGPRNFAGVIGTPGYMAPEQASATEVDQRADIYAFGVTAYEMLTGQLPFPGDTPAEVLEVQLRDAAPRPRLRAPDVPHSLDELVHRMLDRDPTRRPTLHDVRTVFADLLDRSQPTIALMVDPPAANGGSEATPTAVEMVSAPQLRSWGVRLGGAALAVVGIALGIVMLRQRPAPPRVPTPAVQAPSAPAAAPEVVFAPPAPLQAIEGSTAPGRLVVRVAPRGARVELDGQVVRVSNGRAELPVARFGDHTLVVSAPRYRPLRRTITVAPGADLALDVALHRAAAELIEVDRNYVLDPFGRKR